jgi:putative transposase
MGVGCCYFRLNPFLSASDSASKKHWDGLILNYVITSNHVHILVWAPQLSDISAMMHWLQGTVAQDFNRRTRRDGSFWRGRFQPILVQSGSHLARCLLYLDLNMVRAQVVFHPSEWAFGGYQELCGTRKRYRCLDQEKLREFITISSPDKFRQWYEDNLIYADPASVGVQTDLEETQ